MTPVMLLLLALGGFGTASAATSIARDDKRKLQPQGNVAPSLTIEVDSIGEVSIGQAVRKNLTRDEKVAGRVAPIGRTGRKSLTRDEKVIS